MEGHAMGSGPRALGGRGRKALLIAVIAGAALLGAAGLADAAGNLTYQDCLTGESETGPAPGSEACPAISSASPSGAGSGVDRLRSPIVVGDRSLYAVSPIDDSIIRFDRDPATGELSYQGCITGALESGPAPAGSGACAAIASASAQGNNSGFSSLLNVVASADGEWLYTVSQNDASIATFDRDPATGELSYEGCITGEIESGPSGSGACAVLPHAASSARNTGLQRLKAIALSPDGQSLYGAAPDDAAVSHFDRDPVTGELSYEGCISGKTKAAPPPAGSGPCEVISSASDLGRDSGLDQANEVTVSPDGASVYATTNQDDSVAWLDRDSGTGELTYRGCLTGEDESGPAPAGSGACKAVASASPQGDESGFDKVRNLVVSPDGKSAYGTTSDGVLRFTRLSSGALFYRECITGELQSGPGGSGACTQLPTATNEARNSGFDGLAGLALSPNGRSLYVAALDDSAVARFDRRLATGALVHQGCISGDTTTTPCALVASAVPSASESGLDGLGGVTVSPDGKWLYGTAAFDDSVLRFARAVP